MPIDPNAIDLPEGIRALGREDISSSPLEIITEVVIVGLGAGGSMAFHDLAKAGVRVVAVECGSYLPAHAMTGIEHEMMPHVFAENGMRTTTDVAIAVLQGRGVGGSTLHNTNLCKRLPNAIRAEWEEHHGLRGHLGKDLTQDFEDVEKLLGVHPVPDERINRNNALFAQGVDALGYRGGRLQHNRDLNACKGSGLCELGCPNDGKLNAARVLVPAALSAGGNALTDARVDRIITHKNTAIGVEGWGIDPNTRRPTRPFRVHAKRVILAASATSSAAIAQRSKLRDPHKLIGSRLHLHPGATVCGVFDEPVRGWLGTPQAQDCTQFLSFGHQATERVWLVSGFAHPGGASALVPGFGPDHAERMRLYPNIAVIIAMLHDTSSGQVWPSRKPSEHIRIDYTLNHDDRAQMALGLREAARIMLAAGARRVLVPFSPPLWIEREHDLNTITADSIQPLRPSMAAVHPMSTMWMGTDPKTSVTRPTGEHHHTKGLFVADGSLFPTSIGGPPQISIYTFGRRVARHVLQDLAR